MSPLSHPPPQAIILNKRKRRLRASTHTTAGFTTKQTTSGNMLPSQDSSTHCPLVDSFSPELRVRIFEQVLRSEFSLLQAREEHPQEVK
jgi:hypothetical protein